MSKMSKEKGKVGEREAAALLRSFGFDAQRGVQFQGGHDSQDVRHDIPGIHIEVKRVEALNMTNAMKQARADAGSLAAVVLHRKNNAPWLVTMDATDFLKMQGDLRMYKKFVVTDAERKIDRPDFTKVNWNE